MLASGRPCGAQAGKYAADVRWKVAIWFIFGHQLISVQLKGLDVVQAFPLKGRTYFLSTVLFTSYLLISDFSALRLVPIVATAPRIFNHVFAWCARWFWSFFRNLDTNPIARNIPYPTICYEAKHWTVVAARDCCTLTKSGRSTSASPGMVSSALKILAT